MIYGSKQLKTNGMYNGWSQWEILEINSLSGTMWVCINKENGEVKHFVENRR